MLNKKGENTPEHRTLIKCTADLSKAVRADIHTLSGELLGDGLITSDNRDWLNNDAVNLSRRAPELVSMVATKVELDASNFHLFIKTLMRRLNDHREILEMLDSEYKSKGIIILCSSIIKSSTVVLLTSFVQEEMSILVLTRR